MNSDNIMNIIKQKNSISKETKDLFQLVLNADDEKALRKIINHISEETSKLLKNDQYSLIGRHLE